MKSTEPWRFDIVIPVCSEGANILRTLQTLARKTTTPLSEPICYDRKDNEMPSAIRDKRDASFATIVARTTYVRVIHGGWRSLVQMARVLN